MRSIECHSSNYEEQRELWFCLYACLSGRHSTVNRSRATELCTSQIDLCLSTYKSYYCGFSRNLMHVAVTQCDKRGVGNRFRRKAQLIIINCSIRSIWKVKSIKVVGKKYCGSKFVATQNIKFSQLYNCDTTAIRPGCTTIWRHATKNWHVHLPAAVILSADSRT